MTDAGDGLSCTRPISPSYLSQHFGRAKSCSSDWTRPCSDTRKVASYYDMLRQAGAKHASEL